MLNQIYPSGDHGSGAHNKGALLVPGGPDSGGLCKDAKHSFQRRLIDRSTLGFRCTKDGGKCMLRTTFVLSGYGPMVGSDVGVSFQERRR